MFAALRYCFHNTDQPENVIGAVPPGLRGHTATLIGSKIFLYGGECVRIVVPVVNVIVDFVLYLYRR